MDSQQCRIQEDTMCRVDAICSCNVGNERDDDNTVNNISSNINMDNIETEVLILIVVL